MTRKKTTTIQVLKASRFYAAVHLKLVGKGQTQYLTLPIFWAILPSLMQTNVKRPASLSGSARKHIRAYFAAHEGHLPPSGLYGRVIDEVERVLIKETLRVTKKNQIQAAKVLGINRNTLRKKIEQYELMVAK